MSNGKRFDEIWQELQEYAAREYKLVVREVVLGEAVQSLQLGARDGDIHAFGENATGDLITLAANTDGFTLHGVIAAKPEAD